MTYTIEVNLDPSVPAIDVGQLEAAVLAALLHQSVASGEVTLLLSDDYRLRELNRQFRDTDAATDVLSFPSGDTRPSFPGQLTYLGDIAISVPYARRQASAAGHNLPEELQLLAVHGTLHLLGHDHVGVEDKALMWSAQEEIMAQLGLPHVAPTET